MGEGTTKRGSNQPPGAFHRRPREGAGPLQAEAQGRLGMKLRVWGFADDVFTSRPGDALLIPGCRGTGTRGQTGVQMVPHPLRKIRSYTVSIDT